MKSGGEKTRGSQKKRERKAQVWTWRKAQTDTKSGPYQLQQDWHEIRILSIFPQATLAAGCTIFPRVGEWRRAAYTPCAIASVAVEGEKSERTWNWNILSLVVATFLSPLAICRAGRRRRRRRKASNRESAASPPWRIPASRRTLTPCRRGAPSLSRSVAPWPDAASSGPRPPDRPGVAGSRSRPPV
jgi:hypothetical protein